MAYGFYQESPIPSLAIAYAQIDPGVIDPSIQGPGTGHQESGPWTAFQPHRCPQETGRQHYASFSPFDFNTSTNNCFTKVPPHSDGIPPLPSAILIQRQGSPSEQAATYSSTQSSSGESEYSFDHFPPTPQNDPSTMSPFSSHADVWNSSQLYQLTGLANPEAKPDAFECNQGYANLSDDRTPQFLGREFSMSSHGTTGHDADTFPSTAASHLPRVMSPTEMRSNVKEEIYVSGTSSGSVYPQLENGYNGANPDDEHDISIQVFVKEELDDDYKPGKGHRRSATGTGQPSKGRKRAGDSPSSPRSKKSKVGSSSGARSMAASKSGAKSTFACGECNVTAFQDQVGLEKHIKQQHTRPFVCVFGFAGCLSTFASKNEWKRHVSSQHLLLNFWLCDIDGCAKVSDSTPGGGGAKSSGRSRRPHGPSPSAPSGLPKGAIFNRKDLYTQHLRRMHFPPTQKKQTNASGDMEDQVRSCQEKAHRLRCQLPTSMRCPATGCKSHFAGQNAWDDRMEHVAKHLEKAARHEEPPFVFGGDNDSTLTEWACSPEVAVVVRDENARKKWRLNNPFKQGGAAVRASTTTTQSQSLTDSEADADYEVDE